jgi:hypothetical protein
MVTIQEESRAVSAETWIFEQPVFESGTFRVDGGMRLPPAPPIQYIDEGPDGFVVDL